MSQKAKRRTKADHTPQAVEDGEVVMDMDVDGVGSGNERDVSSGAASGGGKPVGTDAADAAPASDDTLDDDETDWALVPADERMSSGFYYRIATKLNDFREWVLAHMDVSKYKFVMVRGNWIVVPATVPDTALPSELAAKEVCFLLTGEVGDPSFGPTGVKATTGKFKKDIVDGANVRAAVKLRPPRYWNPEKLEGSDIFEDQLGTLQELVYLAEGGEEAGRLALANSRKKEATHDIVHACAKSDKMLHAFDRVVVYTDLMYRKDPNAASYLPLDVQRSPAKRKELGEPPRPTEPRLPDPASFTDPKVGDLYDPRLYPKYVDNPLMKLRTSKLAQLDIRDWNDRLLLPWEWPAHLAEGALVLVQARLKVWLVDGAEEKDGFPAKKPAHIYQVIADSIRVMGKAPELPSLQHTIQPTSLLGGNGGGDSSAAGPSSKPAEPAAPAAPERPSTPPSERAPPPPAGSKKHFAWRRQGRSLRATEDGLLRQWCKPRIAQFKKNADVIISQVVLDELAQRGKGDAEVAEAERRIAIMQADPEKYKPIETSTIVKDRSRDREPLVWYYACDPVAVKEKREELQRQGLNPSDDEVADLVREAASSYHGLPSRVVQHFAERTQDIVAVVSPPVKDPDHSSRHRPPGLFAEDAAMAASSAEGKTAALEAKSKKDKKKEMTEEEKMWAAIVHEYSYMEYDLDIDEKEVDNVTEMDSGSESESTGSDDDETGDSTCALDEDAATRFKESIGVLHFAHCWHESGHRTRDEMAMSSDMHGDGSSKRQAAVRAYHYNTRFLRAWIDLCFRASVPSKDYRRYERTYKAGRALGDDIPGVFLAQVVVWKCQSHVHRDTLDGPTDYCVSGAFGGFEGGVIYFPDLWLCFRYKPGDILIFRSADLFHCVGPWTPLPMKESDTITPGRGAFVFFSPQASMRVLNDKPADWFVRTGGGLFEQEVEVRRRRKTDAGACDASSSGERLQ
ncbi:hypothetical protein AURDEDRAFT_170478 [Auricularia subglabra TFB-10046 SS5]|nr:hypothetical protein AURDEDRAFT_170478 [Auricularia subglabra TFB-10046 SS5]